MIDYVKRSVDAYGATQKATTRVVIDRIDSAWSGMDLADLDGSWKAIRSEVIGTATRGQAQAASVTPQLTDRILAADGLSPDPLDSVSALWFAGYTADGTDLQTVLDNTPTVAKVGIARGATPGQALDAAHRRLDRIVATEVQDAGRGALEAHMLLEPQIVGYERRVTLPCCSRCLILAGKFYSKSSGFLRHPNDHCFSVPVTSREGKPEQNPRDLFHSLTDAQQDAAFTPDGARAIRDGADPWQVVNARWQGGVRGKAAGMSRPGDPYTTSGTTKRSAFYRQQKAAGNVHRGRLTVKRLSPQGIALEAGGDTVKYRQLLRDNGYL